MRFWRNFFAFSALYNVVIGLAMLLAAGQAAATMGLSPGAGVYFVQFAGALIAAKHPQFTTVHLRGLDHIEHESGPGSPEAKAALETLDTAVGRLIAEAQTPPPKKARKRA